MGPSESNSPAFPRDASDQPLAGPTAKTMCWTPSSRRAPTQAANASDVISRPRLSINTTTGWVLPCLLPTQSKNVSSALNASAWQCANAEQRPRYSFVNSSKESFEPGRGPIWASVRSMARRIPHTPLGTPKYPRVNLRYQRINAIFGIQSQNNMQFHIGTPKAL